MTFTSLDILIVTKSEKFASAASRQLELRDYSVRIVPPEQALQALVSTECCPVTVLVDCDAYTKEGTPLYKVIQMAFPDCRIMLICTPSQASMATGLIRSGEVCGYVSSDSVRNPDHVPLLVERARTRSPRRSANGALHYRRILRYLVELRELLTSGVDNSVVEVLDRFKLGVSLDMASESLLEELVEGHEHCLVELICRRLRRLETEILCRGRNAAGIAASPAGNRILIVEDDEISGELATNILEKSGFDVTVATTAHDAIDAVLEDSPALILMDIQLGDANGIDLVKTMRRRNICPDVPVIVVTSDRMRETMLYAMTADVQDYILKPYEPRLLADKVGAILESNGHHLV